MLCAIPRGRGCCDERRENGEASTACDQADQDPAVDSHQSWFAGHTEAGEVVGQMSAKKTDYRQPGSGYNQAPPNIVHHPPATMKPKPVLRSKIYSSEQQQKG